MVSALIISPQVAHGGVGELLVMMVQAKLAGSSEGCQALLR